MKILQIIGARPQFMKYYPVERTIKNYNGIRDILVHTGQHYDYNMSKIFFDELDIKEPDYHLGVGSGSHGMQTAQCIERIENVLDNEQPDIVIVYGDTNSTLADAIIEGITNPVRQDIIKERGRCFTLDRSVDHYLEVMRLKGN